MTWQSLLALAFGRTAQRSHRTPPASSAGGSRGRARRALFESLERREVLAASISLGGGGGGWGLDPTFGASGKTITDISSSLADEINDVASYPGGGYVAVGRSGTDFAIVKYDSSGALDPAFDGDGIRVINIGGNDVARGVAVQTDGKIVVVGESVGTGGTNQFVVLRLNVDGTNDNSFDFDGFAVATDFGPGNEQAKGVAIQSSGSIVVVGSIEGLTQIGVARYTTGGALDISFGVGGKRVVDFTAGSTEEAAGIALDSTGRIVVAAIVDGGTREVALARLAASNGAVDATFGGGPFVTTFVDALPREVESVTIDASNRVVVTGTLENTDNNDLFVLRYTAGGVLDTLFDGDGQQTLDLGSNEQGLDVAIQPDGKIVVAGAADGAGSDFLVARFADGGALDTTFDGGSIQTDFSGSDDVATSLVVQTDGKIVLGGRTRTTSGSFNFGLARYAETGGPPPAFAVNEGGSITLTGTYTTDFPGTATITINWGDGSSENVPISPTATSASFSVVHTYLDDVPTSTPVDINTITATITASDGTDSDSTTATVTNLAPAFVSVTSATINENGTATITGSFTDPGTLDTHTIVVTWGDTSTSLATINPDRTFTASHQYLDDNPTGTASDVYAVSLSLTDDDTGTATPAVTTITVNNVAPVVGAISGPAVGVRGQSVSFSGSFTDVGTLDTHTVSWDFGDGIITPFVASTTPGALTPSHTYADAGVYTVKLTVRDDDTGEHFATRSITIVIAELQPAVCGCGTDLVIGGTSVAETIVVSPASGGALAVTVNSVAIGTFSPSHGIVVRAEGGSDDVTIAGSVGKPAWLYGGGGNDRLKGGSGDDVILGQAGDDLLVGASGRDLIIGGVGADRIVGDADDDILIAGTTDFDDNAAALCAIMAEWTSCRSYAVRVFNLTVGSPCVSRENGDFFLMPATVADDGVRDTLTGASGNDWFFANICLDDDSPVKDKITDLSWWDFVRDIDFINS